MSKLTLSFKGKVLKVFPLKEGESFIGSDPGCEIHIDSLAVQARHARVSTHGETSILRDLGTAEGTYVNNNRVQEHTLKDDDLIRVGKHTLTFTFEPPIQSAEVAEAPLEDEPPPILAATKKTAWLQILTGQNVGKTISLSRSLTNLGKPGVQTAVIVRRNDGFFLSHLEGEVPPTVDGISIGDHSWQLEDGQTIQIGNVRMQFYLQ